jgi:hypothetical protein
MMTGERTHNNRMSVQQAATVSLDGRDASLASVVDTTLVPLCGDRQKLPCGRLPVRYRTEA